MITTDQIIEVLKARDEQIADIDTHPKGYVHGVLPAGDGWNRPGGLVVHPILDELILRVCVVNIMNVRPDSQAVKALAKVNLELVSGCVGIEESGHVRFQINHVCSGTDGEASVQVLDRLLDETFAALGFIQRNLLLCGMIEAGVPPKQAHQVMHTLYGDNANEDSGDSEAATL